MHLAVVWACVVWGWSQGLQAQTLDNARSPSAYYLWGLADVVAQHPTVLAADRQRQAAAQDSEGARWRLFPTPSVGIETSNATQSNTDARIRFSRLQQTLWSGGRLTGQIDRSQAQFQLAQATWREQRHHLANRYLELWAEASAAGARLAAYQDSEALHQRYVRRVKARAQEGNMAFSEVQLSLTRLAAVQAEMDTARIQEQQAINKLRQMLAQPWPADVRPILWPGVGLSAESFSEVREWQVPDDHPTLEKSQALIHTAQADVQLARAQLSPEVYARTEVVHGDVSGTVRKTYIGLSTSYSGGLSTFTAVEAAQSRLLAQEQELLVRRKELADALDVDRLQARGQAQRYQRLMQATEAAQAYFVSSENLFAAGRRSWQELMNSARETAQLQAQLADAQAQAWLAGERIRLNLQGLEKYLHVTAMPQ